MPSTGRHSASLDGWIRKNGVVGAVHPALTSLCQGQASQDGLTKPRCLGPGGQYPSQWGWGRVLAMKPLELWTGVSVYSESKTPGLPGGGHPWTIDQHQHRLREQPHQKLCCHLGSPPEGQALYISPVSSLSLWAVISPLPADMRSKG